MAGISDSIQSGLGASSAYNEIKGTIRADGHVGYIEWTALHKGLLRRHVAGSPGGKMHCKDASVGPVHDVKRLLVALGKGGSSAKADTRGRSNADVEGRREAVGVVFGPFAGS